MKYKNKESEYYYTKEPKLRHEIIVDYLPHVEYMAKCLAGRGIEYDELYQEGCVGLLKALDVFDPNKTYVLYNLAKFYIRGHMTELFKEREYLKNSMCSSVDPVDLDNWNADIDSPSVDFYAYGMIKGRALFDAVDKLSDRQRALIERRYLQGEDVTLTKVAKEMGISVQGAADLERRAVAQLTKELNPT